MRIKEAGAREERAAIVKELRERADLYDKSGLFEDQHSADALREAADRIERGEHLKNS